MSLFNFSCGGSAEKSDSTEKDDFPYRAAKTDVKTDGQLYTDGFLNMPSYLWTERKTKDYGELDKGTAKGIFVETLENEYAFADEICCGKTPTIRITSPANATPY